MSQTLAQASRWAVPTPILRFGGRRKSEANRQQLVLFAHRPGAREVKSFFQPQHGFEAPDRSSRRVERSKAADPRHGSLDPEMVALDALLQALGDIMERILRQETVFSGSRDGRRVGSGSVRADPVGSE